jgi:hypothetical protein
MSYRVVIHPDLFSTCRKIRAKDPAWYEQVKKKIRLLVEHPEMESPCRLPLKDYGGFTSGILYWYTRSIQGKKRLFC